MSLFRRPSETKSNNFLSETYQRKLINSEIAPRLSGIVDPLFNYITDKEKKEGAIRNKESIDFSKLDKKSTKKEICAALLNEFKKADADLNKELKEESGRNSAPLVKYIQTMTDKMKQAEKLIADYDKRQDVTHGRSHLLGQLSKARADLSPLKDQFLKALDTQVYRVQVPKKQYEQMLRESKSFKLQGVLASIGKKLQKVDVLEEAERSVRKKDDKGFILEEKAWQHQVDVRAAQSRAEIDKSIAQEGHYCRTDIQNTWIEGSPHFVKTGITDAKLTTEEKPNLTGLTPGMVLIQDTKTHYIAHWKEDGVLKKRETSKKDEAAQKLVETIEKLKETLPDAKKTEVVTELVTRLGAKTEETVPIFIMDSRRPDDLFAKGTNYSLGTRANPHGHLIYFTSEKEARTCAASRNSDTFHPNLGWRVSNPWKKAEVDTATKALEKGGQDHKPKSPSGS